MSNACAVVFFLQGGAEEQAPASKKQAKDPEHAGVIAVVASDKGPRQAMEDVHCIVNPGRGR